MGFRFRKSFKLAPGVRFNLGTRGGSFSLGVRGATMNLSPRGVRSTFGLPGTGMSWSSQVSARSLAGAGSPRQQASAQRAQRIDKAHQQVASLDRAERDVLDAWRDMPELPAPQFYQDALQIRPFEAPGAAPQLASERDTKAALLRDALRSALHDPPYWLLSAGLLAALVVSDLLHTYVNQTLGTIAMLLLGALSVLGPTLGRPLRDTKRTLARWPEAWAEIQQQHALALAEWEQARATTEGSWQASEAERVAWAKRLLAGDVEALGETLGDSLADLDFPFETSCRVGVFDGARAAVLLDLPEIEDVVSETKRRVLRDGSIKESRRTKAERAADYGALAAGLGLWVARACFAAGPTLQTLTVAAYTQRRQTGSGEQRDEFVYELEIGRGAAAAIDGASVAPLELLGKLGARFDLRAGGELKRIEAPAWQQELV